MNAAELEIAALTETSTVVLSDRTVVPLNRCIAEVVDATVMSGRALNLITPPSSRLTMPLVSALIETGGQWVVHDPARHEYYDGLWGDILTWQDGGFRSERPDDPPDRARLLGAGYCDPPLPDGRILRLCFEVRHAESRWVRLGGATEIICEALSGDVPAGWGLVEPVANLWNAAELTAYARDRAVQRCRTVWVGGGVRPAVGTLTVARIPDGVIETADLTIGYPSPQRPDLAGLADVVDAVTTKHDLTWLYAETRLARSDLTRPAYAEGIPIPVGMALGPSSGPHAIGSEGTADTNTETDAGDARLVGHRDRPTLWRPLSAGDSLAGWATLSDLLERIGAGTSADQGGDR